MNNKTTFLMENLLSLKGKSADHVTHFLKECGGGEDSTMVDGLINIVDMLHADKLYSVKNAQINGIVIGIIISTIFGGSAYLIYKYYEKNQSRKQIQEVAEILKQEVSLANQEELPADESEVILKS